VCVQYLAVGSRAPIEHACNGKPQCLRPPQEKRQVSPEALVRLSVLLEKILEGGQGVPAIFPAKMQLSVRQWLAESKEEIDKRAPPILSTTPLRELVRDGDVVPGPVLSCFTGGNTPRSSAKPAARDPEIFAGQLTTHVQACLGALRQLKAEDVQKKQKGLQCRPCICTTSVAHACAQPSGASLRATLRYVPRRGPNGTSHTRTGRGQK
jgi:hypothetical protein